MKTIILILVLMTSCVYNDYEDTSGVFVKSEYGYIWNHGIDLPVLIKGNSMTMDRLYFLIKEKIQYQSDMDTHGISDLWQDPKRAVDLGFGDCEEFAAILLYILYVDYQWEDCKFAMYSPVLNGRHAAVKCTDDVYDQFSEVSKADAPDWECTLEEYIWMSVNYNIGVGKYN